MIRIIEARNLPGVQRSLEEAVQLLGRPEPLLKAFGVAVLGWIGETFQQGGRPPWAPLSPGTLAAREQPTRKRAAAGGSPKPLQSNGALRRSFDFTTANTSVTISSNSPVAIFHEFGTGTHGAGKGPYKIRAKPGHYLALPGLGQGPQLTRKGAGRSRKVTATSTLFVPGPKGPSKRFAGREGQRISLYQNIRFRKEVIHPGVAVRRMTPTETQVAPVLEATARRIIDLTLKRGRA